MFAKALCNALSSAKRTKPSLAFSPLKKRKFFGANKQNGQFRVASHMGMVSIKLIAPSHTGLLARQLLDKYVLLAVLL